MSEYPTRKKLLFALIILAVTVFIAVILGELFLRLFSEYVTPGLFRERNLQYEPAVFSRHVFPRKEVTTEDSGGLKWYINRKGYRGPDFVAEKPEGTVRIIFYGGSFVFDTASRIHDRRESWPHQVGAILRESGFPRVEVINAGVPGHASFDSFGRLFAEGHNFSPDFVVICNAWNDIKYFQEDDYLLRWRKPYESRDYRVDYFSRLDRWLCETSQIYVRLRDRYFSRRYRIGLEGIIPDPNRFTGGISSVALDQFRINLEMFVDLARNIGAVPVLMTQPRLADPGNTEAEKRRIAYGMVGFDHEQLVAAFDKTDRIIREVAREKDAVLIDLAREFTGVGDYFQDHIHLTTAGVDSFSRAVAREMRVILEEKGY